jgi:predicted porin
VETGVNMDSGSQAGQGGQTNASSGFWASRPSFVGLQGGFGRVTLGRQDIWWGNGTLAQTGANYLNAEVPMFTGTQGRQSFGVARQSNVLQYTTPSFAGLNFTGSYSPDASPLGAAHNAEASQGGVKTNARILALTSRGAWGPIGAQIDVAQIKGNSGIVVAPTPDPKRTGIKALLGFTYMPGSQITVLGTQIKRNDSGYGVGNVKQRMIGLNWEHTFGPVQLLAEFGRTGKASGCTTGTNCDNTKTSAYTAGLRYNLSKRTATYVSYNRVTNQANANVDYNGGAITSNAGALAAGLDPQIIGIGVWHQF